MPAVHWMQLHQHRRETNRPPTDAESGIAITCREATTPVNKTGIFCQNKRKWPKCLINWLKYFCPGNVHTKVRLSFE